LVALLTTETLPDTLPAAAGANETPSVADWLGVRVVLALTPLALKPTPRVVTTEIVTFEFPALVTVTFCELLLPTFTFPKLTFVGLRLRVRVAAIPEPLRLTDVGEVGALLTMEMLPDAEPTKVGKNATIIVVCCPALMFNGSVNPLTLKADPDSFTWVMLSVAVPVFVMISAWDRLVPTTAFAKLMELVLN
jgi:hypothetical protein